MTSLKNYTKLYGKNLALKDINLELSGKGLCLVLGGNGAGKSSLLRALSGLLSPTVGTVEVKSSISYLGHEKSLYPQLTVAENLELFSALNKFEGENSDNNWLELKESYPKLVAELSQGQLARIGLARALNCPDSSVLILDEPCASFDHKWQNLFVEKIRQLQNKNLIIVTTHEPQRYIDFASRAIILERAEIIQEFNSLNESNRGKVIESYREAMR